METGGRKHRVYFPAWYPYLLLARQVPNQKWLQRFMVELVTGEISGKGHHGMGVGPWMDLLKLC